MAKVEETYKTNKETGEIFKTEKDWEKLVISPKKTMAQDVKVIMPALDLFSKNKVK